jgi:hypothetical protein
MSNAPVKTIPKTAPRWAVNDNHMQPSSNFTDHLSAAEQLAQQPAHAGGR